MKDRTRKTAERFHIISNVENLEKDLHAVRGVEGVEFDLDGFYDDMDQVIILTKYKVYGDDTEYFRNKRQIIADVVTVARSHGLRRTGDSIEDYGEHFYFVFSCNWMEV